MSNSIWKKPDQKPERNEDILVEYTSTNGLSYYIVDSYLNELLHPKRWAYLTDIIAQADKAERLQKQLDSGECSDGYHTFNELYYHRMCLFSIIVKQNKNLAWKSKLHSDGTMFDNYFIVGIDTPNGQATYHYHIEHWDMFDCVELSNAPEWDGHTAEDAIKRLLSLTKSNN